MNKFLKVNGQLTNYWTSRRALERRDHRFMSDCDSELIAVYVADRIDRGDDLQSAMERSISDLDGVFTYLVATSDKLGMAKDVMAAKPMVLYESDDMIVLASEEIAIRSVLPQEIDSEIFSLAIGVWAARRFRQQLRGVASPNSILEVLPYSPVHAKAPAGIGRARALCNEKEEIVIR